MKESACMVPKHFSSTLLVTQGPRHTGTLPHKDLATQGPCHTRTLPHKDFATHATVHHLYMMIDVVHIVPSLDFLPSQILQ